LISERPGFRSIEQLAQDESPEQFSATDQSQSFVLIKKTSMFCKGSMGDAQSTSHLFAKVIPMM
jgi:hypothetical protein